MELGEGKHPIAWQGREQLHVLWMDGPGLRNKEGVVVIEGAYPAVAAMPDGKAVLVYEAAGKIQIEVK